MTDRIPVVVQGLGALGRTAIEVSHQTTGVELVGVVTRRPDQATDLPDGVVVHPTLGSAGQAHPGAIVLSTVHALADDLADELADAARNGLDVVTSSGLFHPGSELADGGTGLHEVAMRHGVRVFASGVQPGFVLDVLPATVLDLAPGWRTLDVVKPSDARAWPPTTRHMLGLGEPAADLEAAVPYPLAASAHLIADAVGSPVVEVDESRRATTIERDLELAGETIPAGRATGFVHRCAARLDDGRVLSIQWQPTLDVSPTTDLALRLQVAGTPEKPADLELRLDGTFRDDPYPATATRMLHTAVRGRVLPPGLHTVLLPALAWPTPT
jgi:hypothetical protein